MRCGKKYHIPVYVHEKEQHLLGGCKGKSFRPLERAVHDAGRQNGKRGRYSASGGLLKSMCLQHQAIRQEASAIIFRQKKHIFSGDTLFCESYGRYDFPTSSGRDLIASVKRLLKELPGDVTVYPGHNDETTIEHEKRYNPLA